MSDYSLEKIAAAQRGVIACVACNLGIVLLSKVIGSQIALVAMVIVIIASICFIAKLTSALKYNVGVTVISCIAMFVPLLSLIVLLVLNSKATAILKEHGVKVGLFGADLKG